MGQTVWRGAGRVRINFKNLQVCGNLGGFYKLSLMKLKTDSKKIRIEVNLAVSQEKAWELLTESNHIANWWGNHVKLEARPGGAFFEKWFDGEKQVITSGRITHFYPPSVLKVTWADDNWPGETNVIFSLPEGDNETRLILEHSGWEIHSEEERQALIDAHTDGWSHYLQKLTTYAEEIKNNGFK